MKVCEETYRVPWLYPKARYNYDKILELIEYGNAYIEFRKKNSLYSVPDPSNRYCRIISIDDSGIEIVLEDIDNSVMTFVRGMLDSNEIYATRTTYTIDSKRSVMKIFLAYKDNKNRLKFI